jgi:hypothetical protein
LSCDALIQPLFVPIKEAQVPTIGTTLRHDAPIVRLGVAPHFTDALSLNDQEEPNRTAIVANVEGSWDSEDHLSPLPFVHVLIAPDILHAARILPVVRIEYLGPKEWLLNLVELSYVLRVVTIQREESVVRARTTVPNSN